MITNYDKTIAALLVGVISLFLAHYGLKADTNTEAAITTLVTAAIVYLIPNKK